MKNTGQQSEVRSQNRTTCWFVLLALLSSGLGAVANDLASLCADRAAIERVYYHHRLGEKPPFEQALPPATLDNLVRQDLRKEAALKKAYGLEVTPALLDAEVQRINTTTRAPEMLAEIKAALGNDPARFANVFAKPILVERLLREKFDNDDALHAPQRREMERVRNQLLTARSSRGDEAQTSKPPTPGLSATPSMNRPTPDPSQEGNPSAGAGGPAPLLGGVGGGFGKDGVRGASASTNDLVPNLLALLKRSHSNAVTETTWQLGARPAETNAPTTNELEIKKRFGPNAQLLSSPHADDGKERLLYFADLPGELQNVLRVQLRRPSDVSAVIETPGGFLLYVAKKKTDAVLSVAGLSLPKRIYEQWLEEQTQETK